MMLNAQKPKLLHITSSLKMGGAERVLVDLIAALRGDYEHEVIFFHDGLHRATIEGWGIPCHQVQGAVSLYDPLFWYRLVQAIKKAQPACIHSLLWGANWASRLLGPWFKVPVVNALHNNVEGYSRIRRILDTLTLSRAHCFVAVSQGVVASHQRLYPALKTKVVGIIDNGVTVLQEVPSERMALRMPLVQPDDFVIGFVGRFEPEKNPALLIQAFAKILCTGQSAHLVLVGYGSQEVFLRALVLTLGIERQVTFVIGQPAEPYYSLFDCFALSSPREGLSIALLEAMGNGLPCVVTCEDKEHPAIIDGHNGLLVSVYDACFLRDALLHLMRDKKAACRMGNEAKKTVLERYTVERMARSYRDLFNSCMKK